jgi:uncharacterized membrane protein
MHDTLLFLKNNLADHFGIYFLPLYIIGGRPAAILSAQLLGLKMVLLLPVVVLLDTLQIPFFFHLYGVVSDKLYVRFFKDRGLKKEARLRNSKFFRWVKFMGTPGVVVITMLPLKGCGMWSGVLLSKLLGLSKKTGYLLLVFGSIAGCLLILLAGKAILGFGALVGAG